eukprot:6209077-Pleurochrysis_carterae.AAC.2
MDPHSNIAQQLRVSCQAPANEDLLLAVGGLPRSKVSCIHIDEGLRACGVRERHCREAVRRDQLRAHAWLAVGSGDALCSAAYRTHARARIAQHVCDMLCGIATPRSGCSAHA